MFALAAAPAVPMDYIGPALGADLFIAIMSLIPHPARRSFNAIFAAGAVGAYIGGGFGVWELIYPALATPVVYLGLRSYRLPHHRRVDAIIERDRARHPVQGSLSKV